MQKTDFDIVIEKGSIERNYLYDLWRYRELFYILSWRDIKVRYKQTGIGIAWALLRPLLTMFIFTFVFSKVAQLPTEAGLPYPVMVLVGLLPWQFFANALSESANSLLENERLITKVYFPRLIIPASAVITSFIDFVIALSLLAGLLLYYQVPLSWNVMTLPLLLLWLFGTAFGLGLLLTALNVKYRDFRYALPFIIQIGLYISPVGYSSQVVPAAWQWLYALNPMVGVIDTFRWAILDTPPDAYFYYRVGMSIGVSLALLLTGFWYFRRTERSFADII